MNYWTLLLFLLLTSSNIVATPTSLLEKDPTKALFQAIEASELDAAKVALDAGANVNALYNYPDERHGAFFAFWRPIHMAAYYGKIDIILLLVRHGAEVKVQIDNKDNEYADFQGRYPIHFAAASSSGEQGAILDLFISKGLSINQEGNYGWLPINEAIISKYCGAKGLQTVIDKGANVNPKASVSPLCWALSYEDNEKFKVVMNAGGDIHAIVDYASGSGDGSCSVLDVALYRGNNYIAKLLIEKGVDINGRTPFGYSHLHWCAMGRNKSMAYYFMRKGLDPNEKAENGRSPMSIAASNDGATLVDLFKTGYMSKTEQEFYTLVETEEYQNLKVGSNYKGDYFSAKNIRGGTITSDKYKGKILFLNIWGTWCPPCVQEMPSMQTLYDKMKGKDFAMLASSYEGDFDKIKNFADGQGFTFDVVQDADQSLVTSYPSMMPTSYIIDKKGNVLARIDGSTDWDEEKYIKLFELLVKM